jgi:hypothetical protein
MQVMYEAQNTPKDEGLDLSGPGSFFNAAHRLAKEEGISYDEALGRIRKLNHEKHLRTRGLL